MTILPQHIREQLPILYANESLGLDAEAKVKFFLPGTGWVWYASEFDGEDILFGLVIGHFAEFGYFSLSELESVKGPLGLSVERSLHFTPTTLGGLKGHYEQNSWAL